MAAKKTSRKTPEPTLRHVWLAGLGLVSVARREAFGAVAEVGRRIDAARQQATTFANSAQRDVLGRLADVRELGEARVGQFSADVEGRLDPVLVKLGLKKPARKAPRTRKSAPTRAKVTRKPGARKAAAGRTRRA